MKTFVIHVSWYVLTGDDGVSGWSIQATKASLAYLPELYYCTCSLLQLSEKGQSGRGIADQKKQAEWN